MHRPYTGVFYAEARERGPLDHRLDDFIAEEIAIDENRSVYNLDHAITVEGESITFTQLIERFEDELPTTGTTWIIYDGMNRYVGSFTTEYAADYTPTANTREALAAAAAADHPGLARAIRRFATTDTFTSGTKLTADQWLGIFATGMRNTTVNA